MENTTIVTALYNIQRETHGDGRKWEEYLQWFQETLQIPLSMVIFIPKELEPFVMTHRPSHYKTQVIFQELSDVPYAYCLKKIEANLQDPSYLKKMRDTRRVECVLPYYTIIQYSKFRWLLQTIEKNPFQSQYFFWMDAGISRFIPKEIYSRTKTNLVLPENKFVIQNNHLLYQYPVNEKYLWDSQCLLCGTMFGGDSKVIQAIATIIDNYFVAFLNMGWINNEQILLAYIYKEMASSLFHLIHNNTGKHLCLYESLFIK